MSPHTAPTINIQRILETRLIDSRGESSSCVRAPPPITWPGAARFIDSKSTTAGAHRSRNGAGRENGRRYDCSILKARRYERSRLTQSRRDAGSHYVSLISSLIHLSAPGSPQQHPPAPPSGPSQSLQSPVPGVGLKITNVGRLGAAITTGHSFRASDESAGSREPGTAIFLAHVQPLSTRASLIASRTVVAKTRRAGKIRQPLEQTRLERRRCERSIDGSMIRRFHLASADHRIRRPVKFQRV